MKAAPEWALKVGSVGLTMVTAVVAAVFVGGHVKNSSAPLQPKVVAVANGEIQPSPTPADGVHLTPSVRQGGAYQPVTSTYAS
ncbi:MAG TPA: hypothetical protein VG015_06105 [Candidatus Dormibacteraeota bacterium]|jgi:hypothetical protein|nr:hypothetical protein [Candidatus Dormibacteraeota bacterium]